MKNTLLTLLIAALLSSGIKAYSQSRSSVGFGYGINKPYSGDYKFAKSFQLQGNIAVAEKWAVSPAIGYDRLLSNNRIIYSSPNFHSLPIGNSDLMYLGASARYSLNKEWFAKAGPIFYVIGGNEDVANVGIGGSGCVGYNLNFTDHSTLALSLSTEIVNIPAPTGNGITPVAGLKIAYVFNFMRLK